MHIPYQNIKQSITSTKLQLKVLAARYVRWRTHLRPHRRPFIIAFAIVLSTLLIVNLFTQIAIQEDWTLFVVIIIGILGATTLWIQCKAQISRHFKNAVLGTLVPLGCIFFFIIFMYSASRGNWLEAANILLAALAALWVLFNDLVTDSNNTDEKKREGHILQYSRKATVYIFMSLAVLVLISAGAASLTRPKLKVAISLPLANYSDIKNSLPLYRAYRQACSDRTAQIIQTATKLPGCNNLSGAGKDYDIELLLFDDSRIAAGEDCTKKDSCALRVIPTKELDAIIDSTKTDSPKDEERLYQKVNELLAHQQRTQTLQGLMNTPNLVAALGPFNSGVAILEIPAVSRLSIPLVSASTTADCLTNPEFAEGECSTAKLGGKGYYYRTITPDSIRNKLLASYIYEHYGESDGLQTNEVVIFEQSGPRANFFANSFTQTFIEGLRQAKADQAKTPGEPGQPRVILAADKMTINEIRAQVCNLSPLPKVIVYSGTGELNAKIYQALDCEQLKYKTLAYVAAGSAEHFITSEIAQENHKIYTIHGSIITHEKTAAQTLPDKSTSSREYAAQAYDTAGLVFDAVVSATDAMISEEDPWNVRSLTLHLVNLPKLLALAGAGLDLPIMNIRIPLVIPLGINHDLSTKLNTPLRQAVAIKISQTNTMQDTSHDRTSLTGTYSFNDNGDVNGAAGATIRVFCNNDWKKVTDSVNYPLIDSTTRHAGCLDLDDE